MAAAPKIAGAAAADDPYNFDNTTSAGDDPYTFSGATSNPYNFGGVSAQPSSSSPYQRKWAAGATAVTIQQTIGTVGIVRRAEEVQRELAPVDAAAAQCFKVEDRERLLGIIEAAFGDFGAFNAEVRKIFEARALNA